ncbi:MAG: class I SAM-dependent methyltransferase [Candidatus Rokubacteria bacterium]|nr:class I SAM-dependent methyltransferase [Candidatus Rokubacteria bacterium]
MTGVPPRQAERVSTFFSDFAGTWDTLYGGRRNAFWRLVDRTLRRDIYERYEETFKRLGADLSGRTVIDIGCGTGTYSLEAARRGAGRVVGLDIAPGMVAHARARARTLGVDDVCEFVDAEFPDGCPPGVAGAVFDYGVVMGVMDYVADAPRFLARLRPLVGRCAVLSFPGRHWFREPARRLRYRLLGRCAVYGYDEAAIMEASLAAGFRRLDIHRIDHSGICYIVTAHVESLTP